MSTIFDLNRDYFFPSFQIVENEINPANGTGITKENADTASITLEPLEDEDEKKKKTSGCRC